MRILCAVKWNDILIQKIGYKSFYLIDCVNFKVRLDVIDDRICLFQVCVFIENGYLKDTQEGIINMYNEVQNAEK